jgi:hypothetical protein
MSTDFRIEHLVIDGIQLSRRERDALGPAIARELRRLARLPETAMPDLRSENRGPRSAADGVAQQVAAAVHQATTAALPAPEANRHPVARRGRR